ncbi:MAG TPA: hypothetical protein VEK57_22605 [Thermoanaerobaculia bacterium]|nr:hypothetical protein [Thermoanaerobaculia bacterium]
MRYLAIFLLLFAACSSETPASSNEPAQSEAKPAAPPPSVQQAQELIANAPDLAELEFTNAAVSIPVAGSSMSEVTRGQAKELAAAGWISFDGAGDIMLNDKSRSDKRFLLRPNGILDVVPLAKKELVQVEAVRADPDGTASADFTFKWIPNEVGASFQSGIVADRYAAMHKATATFIWDGTSWSVLKIEGR